jgi:hypothetical protein
MVFEGENLSFEYWRSCGGFILETVVFDSRTQVAYIVRPDVCPVSASPCKSIEPVKWDINS